jgi:apolipoprotein D and lipocalin family protein
MRETVQPTWWRRCLSIAGAAVAIGGCSILTPIPVVEHVDLDRFMGDWYVIANIPTFLEKGAHNAIESYKRNEDGTIQTTFTFRKGSFDGPEKVMRPTGYIMDDPSHAVWGMQFIWPIQAEYRIVYLSEDYGQTVIGRSKRDYLWIMARQPNIPDSDYQHILRLVAELGYDTRQIQKVPQRW